MVTGCNRCTQPIVPCYTASVFCDMVAVQVIINRFELLNIQQKNSIPNIFIMGTVIPIRYRINCGVIGKINTGCVDITCRILRMGNDRTLLHRSNRSQLIRTKAAKEALLLVICCRFRIDRILCWRISAKPFHFSCFSVGIEPRTYVAVSPVVRTKIISPAIAPMRACFGIFVGFCIIGHVITQYSIRKHQWPIAILRYTTPHNWLSPISTHLNVVTNFDGWLVICRPNLQRA